MIDNHDGALERLRAHLDRAPRTAAECFAPLFKREIDAGTYGLALVEAVAHLNHLLNAGRGDPHGARGRGMALVTCRQSATPLTLAPHPACMAQG
jgi:hypothetical protein